MLGAAQFGMENYEEAETTFERAVKRNPDNQIPLIYLASSYGHLGRMREAEDTIETVNDLRATLGLGALSLERAVRDGYSPFTGEIDFKRFGGRRSQERLRKGLSDIPALTWQYLITVHKVLTGDAGNTWFEMEGATEIDLATAKSFHDKGVVFIDTGSEALWKQGRVPGAVNLPFSWAVKAKKRFRETTLSEIVDKTEEVVIYWWAPGFAGIPVWVTAKAVNWGYQKVHYFVGGVPAWKESGYPIETDD